MQAFIFIPMVTVFAMAALRTSGIDFVGNFLAMVLEFVFGASAAVCGTSDSKFVEELLTWVRVDPALCSDGVG